MAARGSKGPWLPYPMGRWGWMSYWVSGTVNLEVSLLIAAGTGPMGIRNRDGRKLCHGAGVRITVRTACGGPTDVVGLLRQSKYSFAQRLPSSRVTGFLSMTQCLTSPGSPCKNYSSRSGWVISSAVTACTLESHCWRHVECCSW